MDAENVYRVIGSEGGLYEVVSGKGERLSCKPRGKFRHEKIKVLVGDYVTLFRDEQGNICIDTILPRKNALLRPKFAGADRLFIVFSVKAPAPILLNVDKLTAIAEQNQIKPVIVLSKCELDDSEAQRLFSIYATTGYPVFRTSCQTGQGVGELYDFIINGCGDQTSVFCGSSGVGKSTLLNALFPALRQRTQSLSEKIARGRHTTRTVDLFPLFELAPGCSGYIADTPGFSLLDFESFDFFSLEDLPGNFPEFRRYLGACRYTKCTHRKEEGCALLERMRAGEIAKSRMESYALLYAQLKEKQNYKKQSHF